MKKRLLFEILILIIILAYGCEKDDIVIDDEDIANKLPIIVNSLPSTEITTDFISSGIKCSKDEDCDSSFVKTVCLKCPDAK